MIISTIHNYKPVYKNQISTILFFTLQNTYILFCKLLRFFKM